MRLFLLPISTRQTLIYCERVIEQQPAGATPSLFGRIAAKASKTATEGWAEWEAKPKGWKKQVTVYGNQLLRQISHQEWALKGIPPLTAKRLTQLGEGQPKVECLYPARVLHASRVEGVLEQLATERQPFHRKRMWQSAAVAPLMLPFALIPMIPNLPLGYMLFRTWSHYRALNGGRYLQALQSGKLIIATPSKAIDDIYEESRRVLQFTPAESDLAANISGSSSITSSEGETLLLRPSDGKVIADVFTLPEMQIEVERAVEQVELALGAKHDITIEKKESLDRV
ncbi:hypothetical protein LTR66_002421 [Elasticomyces elasticus]|nr:hypothetical protein LTR66_002421 [Elasticomyces elasticus]